MPHVCDAGRYIRAKKLNVWFQLLEMRFLLPLVVHSYKGYLFNKEMAGFRLHAMPQFVCEAVDFHFNYINRQVADLSNECSKAVDNRF